MAILRFDRPVAPGVKLAAILGAHEPYVSPERMQYTRVDVARRYRAYHKAKAKEKPSSLAHLLAGGTAAGAAAGALVAPRDRALGALLGGILGAGGGALVRHQDAKAIERAKRHVKLKPTEQKRDIAHQSVRQLEERRRAREISGVVGTSLRHHEMMGALRGRRY